MSQSLARVWIHLIFSTKNRFPFLTDKALRIALHAYIATVLRNHDCETLIVGGVDDHLHSLFALSRKFTIADIVKEVKRTSSSWVKDEDRRLLNFHWQNGYGAFSVSQSDLREVAIYIESQEEHHKRETFQEEYRRFLIEYGVDFDERYVWD